MSLAFVRLLRYIEQIDSMLPRVFFFIKIDHGRGQNVLARTSGADLANGSCIIFLFSPHFNVICNQFLDRRPEG